MFGFIGVIFSYFFYYSFYFLFYVVKLLFYIFIILLFVLYKHQGAILYQRNSPSRKRQIAYNPNQFRTPQTYSMDFDDFFILTQDNINIHCWLLRQPNSAQCSTLVMFHGNAGNIGHRLPNAWYLFRSLKCNLLLIDYRGYGNSEGIPTEQGLINDGKAVLSHLSTRQDIDPSKIFIFGCSLGGAVAIDLGWRYCKKEIAFNNVNILGILIENTFTSILDMVFIILEQMFNRDFGDIKYFRLFLTYFITNRWNSIHKISEITLPILFISGLQDEIIPCVHMQKLYNNASSSSLSIMKTYADGDHNSTWQKGGQQYYDDMCDFMTNVLNNHTNPNSASNSTSSNNIKIQERMP